MLFRAVLFVAALLAPLLTIAQTANMPVPADLSVGDTWRWQQVDNRTKVKEPLTSLTVVIANGHKMLSSGSQLFDLADNYVDGRYRVASGADRKSDAQPWRVWPLEVGKKWTFDTDWVRPDGVTGNIHQDVEVEVFEEVEVPAGRFMAFRVVHKGFFRNSNGSRGRETDTYWYAPEVKADVKKSGDDGFNVYTRELMSYSRGSPALESAVTAPASSVGTRAYLDKERLTVTFIGKSVRMRRYADGVTVLFSFNKDGTAVREREAGKNRITAGTWEMGASQICAHFGVDEPCFKLFDDNGVLKAGPVGQDARWEVIQTK